MISIDEINSVLNSLIFDRTQSDVDYAAECVKNGVNISGNLKGAYNISDRNRIGTAVNLISEYLTEYGVQNAVVKIKDNWVREDIIRRENHDELLSALKFLKNFLPYAQMTAIPTDLNALTYQKANAIEHVVFDIGGVFARFMDSWLYCGDGYASETDYPWNSQGFE